MREARFNRTADAERRSGRTYLERQVWFAVIIKEVGPHICQAIKWMSSGLDISFCSGKRFPKAFGALREGELEATCEHGAELVRWDHFKLGVRAGGGWFVQTPPSELGYVAEAVALHVLVGDFEDEFGA